MLKHYSHDSSVEIVCNKTDNSTKFVFYLGGDAYSAPAILISDGEAQKLYYLHRDYLGSIVMLTDEDGNIAERRHFDPWGQPIKVEDGAGKVLQGLTLLDRGFTGHEHLKTVGFIHMNGRLYDPALHRFLQPDNYVQDLFNTQNFNRYGYCLNNPLLYTDPTGEWFVIDDVIVMLVGGAVNLTINAIQGNVTSFWNGLGYFVVGVGAGAASLYGGPLAGGAVLGFGNNITTQVSQNGWSNIDWTSAIIDTGIGIGTAYIGGQFSGISSKIFKDVSSPVLRNVLISGTSNAASGFVVSGGASYIMNGDVDQAFKDGLRGSGYGLTLGTISGFVQGFQYAREKGVNPWNGIIYEEKLMQRSAIFADDFVPFTKNDGVTGTLKHQAASTLLKRYQNIYGDRGLRFGEYFNNNKILGLGNRGFLDVVNHKTMNIYDFKFGGADWRKGQFEKYQRNYKGYKIFKIKP
ncbi:RHS repeat domain-containing protein [Capnocytophaga sp. oral taxon 902]|uniref:RHS repeat domain-containing protein n=1 Tax=Capnocytophaga sp. oral taxon 902 TaxID=2748316 RepID=UPI0021036F27|nr:RHS repeat-associated core domain-containing protein [Capnocytophaga sp. oral taxon 902]